jgi:hypothetical protein
MKLKIIATAAGLAFLTFAAGSVQAATSVFKISGTNVLTISGTAQIQSTKITTNFSNGTGKVSAPTKYKVDTKQILVWLAWDEHAEGNYLHTNFPAGAKLVAVVSNNTAIAVQVVDKTNKFLVDVSDILSSAEEDTIVYSGTFDQSRLPTPSATVLRLWTGVFDDTTVPGGIGAKFTMTGLESATITAKSGFYTVSAKVTGGIGDGSYQDLPLFMTGGATLSGAKTTLVP